MSHEGIDKLTYSNCSRRTQKLRQPLKVGIKEDVIAGIRSFGLVLITSPLRAVLGRRGADR
jgi:hypothetical protein